MYISDIDIYITEAEIEQATEKYKRLFKLPAGILGKAQRRAKG